METQQCIVPVLCSSPPRRSLCWEQAPAVVSLGTDWNGKEINKLKCFQECIKSIWETQPTHWGNVYSVVWEHGAQKELASATESSYFISQRLLKWQNNLSQVFEACGNHIPYCSSPHLICPLFSRLDLILFTMKASQAITVYVLQSWETGKYTLKSAVYRYLFS